LDVDLRQLRQRCEARLSELDLPEPLTVQAYRDAVAERRGRPMEFRPVAFGTGLSGGWIPGPDRDYVFYERETTLLHQELICLHEVSHMLCGHRPPRVTAPEVAALLFPDVPTSLVQRMLQRAGYSTEEEREAELLASLVLKRTVGGPPRPEPQPLDTETVGVLRRLEASLERDRSS
jgi:hypothetical protein